MSGGFSFEIPYEGVTNDWFTPISLVKMLGDFDLDPCEGINQTFHLAKNGYSPPMDGLSLEWVGRVFCNPPYGPNVEKWVSRMRKHGNGIMLIFARTETSAWRLVWETGDAFLFLTGRISFRKHDGSRAKSGTAPSALIAYGESNVKSLKDSSLSGAFFRNVEMISGKKASDL